MCVRMRKPWHQWVEQLFSDESVEAQCDALRGLVELPLPYDTKASDVPVQAIAEAVRGRVAHTQMEHAPCVRQEVGTVMLRRTHMLGLVHPILGFWGLFYVLCAIKKGHHVIETLNLFFFRGILQVL